MSISTTYSEARAHLATLLDTVVDNREVVIVNRRGKDPVAMIAAEELSSLLETAHLLRSPKNAQRLLSALQKARSDKGTRLTIDQLQRKMGIDSE